MQQHLADGQTPVEGGNRCVLETCQKFGGQERTELPTMLLPVNKSAPVKLTSQGQITRHDLTAASSTYTIMTNPSGKMSPATIDTSPGAFSWNHGAVVALRDAAAAKLNRQPAEMAETNILSGLMLPFLTPARDTSSIASAGVYAPKPARFAIAGSAILTFHCGPVSPTLTHMG